MRKPLLALSLVLTTGCGAPPVANALAATAPSSQPANQYPAGPPPANPPPASSPSVSSPRSAAGSSTASATQAVSGAAIVRTAMQYLGYPYTATGNSPSTGFSCIGFASYVYRQNGIPLPGDLASALAYAPRVSFSAIQPGDLLFFQGTMGWSGPTHVAIYIGGGKMVHAEWYNRGVVVTSFQNDSVDGNYWPAHYLAANRPWTGASVGAVAPTGPSTTAAPAPPATSVTAPVAAVNTNAPSGTIMAAGGLRLRSSPSTSASVLTILPSGSKVYIIGSQGGYYKVQLSDGTVGWVDKSYVQTAGAATTAVGNPTAPSRVSKPGTTKRQSVITVSVTSLNVRSTPSSSGAVIGSVYQGQKLVVVGKSNGWYKVQLPNGTVGWVSADYVAGKPKSSSGSTKSGSTKSTGSASGGTKASAALNVRSGPSLTSPVITVIPPGGSYQIVSWQNGWAKVRLPDGSTGWVSGTVVSGSSPSYSSKTNSGTKKNASGYTHKITAGVNIRSGASVNSAVVGMAAAGTKVKVLGYKNGWTHVRLQNGLTGYVLGTYVS
jgi:uncharacterized protein YgiM (DUF1202 family)/cell wall-associated NlpC family hydrolase